MKHKVIIPGDFPSLNEFIDANRRSKGKWNKGNQMKQRDQSLISSYILKQHKRLHIQKPITLKYTFYCKNRRKDLDNVASYFMKVFQDALVHSKVIENDSWKYIVGFTCEFYVDSKYPRIEVELEEVGEHNGKGR